MNFLGGMIIFLLAMLGVFLVGNGISHGDCTALVVGGILFVVAYVLTKFGFMEVGNGA